MRDREYGLSNEIETEPAPAFRDPHDVLHAIDKIHEQIDKAYSQIEGLNYQEEQLRVRYQTMMREYEEHAHAIFNKTKQTGASKTEVETPRYENIKGF